ncbi:hypothetical protein BH09PSE5_BH09PSE5_18660 [soil metagenome]
MKSRFEILPSQLSPTHSQPSPDLVADLIVNGMPPPLARQIVDSLRLLLRGGERPSLSSTLPSTPSSPLSPSTFSPSPEASAQAATYTAAAAPSQNRRQSDRWANTRDVEVTFKLPIRSADDEVVLQLTRAIEERTLRDAMQNAAASASSAPASAAADEGGATAAERSDGRRGARAARPPRKAKSLARTKAAPTDSATKVGARA